MTSQSMPVSDLDMFGPEPEDHCATCGKELPRDAFYGRRRFCSAKCRMRWHYLEDPDAFRGGYHGERTCPQCGTVFEARAPGHRFCSRACHDDARRLPPDEKRARQRERLRAWRAANPERSREQWRRANARRREGG